MLLFSLNLVRGVVFYHVNTGYFLTSAGKYIKPGKTELEHANKEFSINADIKAESKQKTFDPFIFFFRRILNIKVPKDTTNDDLQNILDKGGKALDISGRTGDLISYPLHGGPNQDFSVILTPDDTFIFKNKKKCMSYNYNEESFQFEDCNKRTKDAFRIFYALNYNKNPYNKEECVFHHIGNFCGISDLFSIFEGFENSEPNLHRKMIETELALGDLKESQKNLESCLGTRKSGREEPPH